jgi:hypothetical protein
MIEGAVLELAVVRSGCGYCTYQPWHTWSSSQPEREWAETKGNSSAAKNLHDRGVGPSFSVPGHVTAATQMSAEEHVYSPTLGMANKHFSPKCWLAISSAGEETCSSVLVRVVAVTYPGTEKDG